MASGRRGRPPHPDILTPAEWRVLEHLREGQTNAEIAVRLGITPDGVKFHVSNMLAKLNLPDRAALAAWDGGTTESRPHRLLAAAWRVPLIVKVAAGLATILALGAGTTAAISLFEGDDASSIPDIAAPVQLHSMDITLDSSIDPGPPGGGDAQSSTTRHRWGVDQGTRLDTTPLPKDGSPPNLMTTLVATAAGVFSWTLPSPEGEAALQVEQLPYPPEAFMPQGVSTSQPPPTLRELVAKLARGGSARLASEDVIAGRPAYRIEIQPSNSCPPILATADGLQTYWLDKETFAVLGQIVLDKAGHAVIQQRATSVSYNPPIDSATFSPPPGAQIQPQHDTGTTVIRTNDICNPSGFTTKVSDIATGSGHLQPPTATKP